MLKELGVKEFWLTSGGLFGVAFGEKVMKDDPKDTEKDPKKRKKIPVRVKDEAEAKKLYGEKAWIDKDRVVHKGGAKSMSAPGGQKVWVENKGDAHPKPGDIYILVNPGGAQIKHIGVFVGSEPKDQDSEYWTTGDAGQGMGVAQKAVYSTKEGRGTEGEQAGRIYNKKDKTVTGTADKGEVLGWVDLDAALAWQAADDAAKAKAQADAAAKKAAKKKK